MKETTFELSEEFISNYRGKQPKFGQLGYITYKRTYARPLPDGKSEEYWQTVKRVVDGVYTIQKRHCERNSLPFNQWKAQASAQKMFQLMWDFKFTPPGRGLWMMGTDYMFKRGGAALNNCFSGNTEFYTNKGTVKFSDVIGETVDVLTMNNEYKPAKVKSYGKQKLQKVVFKPAKRSNHRIEIDVTKNHRWILNNGLETTDIRVGDKILRNNINQEINNDKKYDDGFAHGIIFGDGTQNTYYPKRHFIRLCDKKDRDNIIKLLESIKGYKSTTYPKSFKGDPVVTIIRKENWKQLPINNSDDDYILGFIEGWIYADAHNKPFGQICMNTQNNEASEWLIKNSAKVGYFVTGHSIDVNDTNYGKRKNPLHKISMDNAPIMYVVEKIINEGREEEVFCVEEPETHTFTLAGGIPTGNCAFTSSENIDVDFAEPFCFLMDMSMLGVGVGGDTKGAGKVTIKEPKIDGPYVVADTREGWIDITRKVLNAFVGKDTLPSEVDYSLVRPLGAKIAGFGGVASGPAPLKELIDTLIVLLGERVGQPVTSSDIVDIFNMVGKCVVSGNVRRSAEIMFGELEDKEFMELKDPEKNKKALMSHRWASNNSIFAKVGMDYSKVAEMTAKNGEPGFMWLDNAQKYSRMNGKIDNKDYRAKGGNPCLEQTLEPYELCCLVETYPSNHDTLEEWQETLKFAYMYAKTVTLVPTHNELTNSVMLRNRRIGCSMSGIVQAFKKFGRRTFLDSCDSGYDKIQRWDRVYSDWLCVPRSIKTTSVKPSGCFVPETVVRTSLGKQSLYSIFKSNGIDLGEKGEEYREWYDTKKDIFVYDENNDKQKITKLFVNGYDKTLKLEFDDGTKIECTPNHKFKLTDGSWKEAKDLNNDDEIETFK